MAEKFAGSRIDALTDRINTEAILQKIGIDLHHVDRDEDDQLVADWEGKDRSELNPHQLRAVRTHGIDTPGNRRTTLGIIKVGLASWLMSKGYYIPAAPILGDGLYEDRRDGKRAEETETKSPGGRKYDVTADKAKMVTAIAGDVLGDEHAIPGYEIAAMAVPMAVSTYQSTRGEIVDKVKMDTPLISKAGYFSQCVWAGSRITAKAVEQAGFKESARKMSRANTAIFVGSLALSVAGSIALRRQRLQLIAEQEETLEE